MSPSPFGRLPDKTWESIFRELPAHDVHNLQFVCRTFHDIIKNSQELKYLIALSCEGMVDTNISDLPFSDRLDRLHERRAAWDNLNWKLLPTDPTPFNELQAYDLLGDLFVMLQDRDIFVIRLPSKTDPSRQVLSSQLDISALKFVLDPTQDVIIFLVWEITPERQYTLHVRSLTSTQRHPDARTPTLSVPCEIPRRTTLLQINGDQVGFLHNNTPTGELHIWNWKTGERLVDKRFSGDLPMDFTFLDSESFALAFPAAVGQGCGCIKIFTLTSPTSVAILLFPQITEPVYDSPLQRFQGEQGFRLLHVSLETPGFLGNHLPNRIFTTARNLRVHTLTLYYVQRMPTPLAHRFLMFVLNDALIPFTKRSSESKLVIPWEEWGPQNTRIIEYSKHFEGHNYSYGSRVLLPTYGWVRKLELFDFNYHRPPDPESESNLIIRRHSQPTTISIPRLFERDVITTLPYFSWTKPLPRDLWDRDVSFMIDEDRVVGVLNGDTGYSLFTFAM